MYNIEEKIKYTHLGKDLLKKVYKNKGIVHSDIHFGQFMFDPKKGTVALLDFDNSKINDLVPYKRYLSSFAREFLGYNDYDKYLDIHLFNLLTFALLNNMSMSVAFSNLKNPKCNMLFTSKNALKLLEDISIYKRNNNYLIDSLDIKRNILGDHNLKNIMLGDASIHYSFYAGMGSPMIANTIFYCLSPVNLLLLAIKDARYALLFIYMLKVSLSGLSMFILLKNKRDESNFNTILFSTCYAFSSFVINYFISFNGIFCFCTVVIVITLG